MVQVATPYPVVSPSRSNNALLMQILLIFTSLSYFALAFPYLAPGIFMACLWSCWLQIFICAAWEHTTPNTNFADSKTCSLTTLLNFHFRIFISYETRAVNRFFADLFIKENVLIWVTLIFRQTNLSQPPVV